MKKLDALLIALALGLTLGLGSLPALAQDAPPNLPAVQDEGEIEDGLITGVLEVVNPAGGTVTLDGVTYSVPKGVADLAGFSAGDDVILAYVFDPSGGMQAISLKRRELG